MTLLLESFLFGLANSLHCACMCGPLALAFHGGAEGALTYHSGRATSYAALGLSLGALGAAFGAGELGAPSSYVAFTLAAGLVVLALFGERGALKVPGFGSGLRRAMHATRAWSPAKRACVLGVLTPLLPCGLLWSAFAGAAVAGSAIGGAAVMLGFALGSLPLLLIAQTQVGRISARLGPRALRWLQRAAMLLAAGTLVWRGTLGLSGDSCCH